VPIATILGATPYAEDRLLAVAAAYQALTDWHLRRPADPPGEAPEPIPVEPRPGRARGPAARMASRVGPAPADPARGRLSAAEVAELTQ
jgi:hypothetical protein